MVPKIATSSARAVWSSGARKNGYVLDKIQSKMTPAAHMSTEVVWCSNFSRTSGGLNPGVPALAALWALLLRHLEHTLGCPKQLQAVLRIGVGNRA